MPFVNIEWNQRVVENDTQDFSCDIKKLSEEDLCAVDQFDAQPFMRGENGFNRNVISQIMAAESEDLRAMLLQRINSEPAGYAGYPKDTPADIVIDAIMPRCVQTASSCRDWISSHDKSIAKYTDDLQKQYDDIKKREENEVISFNEEQRSE